jgi:hypothetical protein
LPGEFEEEDDCIFFFLFFYPLNEELALPSYSGLGFSEEATT